MGRCLPSLWLPLFLWHPEETLRTRPLPLPLRLRHHSDLLLPCHRLLRCALLVLLLVLKSPSNLREWPLPRQQPLLVLNVMRTRLKLLWSWTAVCLTAVMRISTGSSMICKTIWALPLSASFPFVTICCAFSSATALPFLSSKRDNRGSDGMVGVANNRGNSVVGRVDTVVGLSLSLTL